jgi:hypothetical protein
LPFRGPFKVRLPVSRQIEPRGLSLHLRRCSATRGWLHSCAGPASGGFCRSLRLRRDRDDPFHLTATPLRKRSYILTGQNVCAATRESSCGLFLQESRQSHGGVGLGSAQSALGGARGTSLVAVILPACRIRHIAKRGRREFGLRSKSSVVRDWSHRRRSVVFWVVTEAAAQKIPHQAEHLNSHRRREAGWGWSFSSWSGGGNRTRVLCRVNRKLRLRLRQMPTP